MVHKAQDELQRAEYGSAVKYAEAAIKVANRMLAKARPEVSVLAVVRESFAPGQPTDVKAIVMNTGVTHAYDVHIVIEGDVLVDSLKGVDSLGVNEFVNRSFKATTKGTGDIPIKVSLTWKDKAGNVQHTDGSSMLKSLESKKKLSKNLPVISIGNVQKLVQRVAASKKGAGDAKMAQEVAKNKCPRCGNLLTADLPNCPRCGQKLK
jgi:hypothetical protein